MTTSSKCLSAQVYGASLSSGVTDAKDPFIHGQSANLKPLCPALSSTTEQEKRVVEVSSFREKRRQ